METTAKDHLVLTRDVILATLREQKAFLGAEYGVKRIGLFGSFADNRGSEKSDIDLVVEFDRPIGLKFVLMVEYLEGLFGRKVDVLTSAGIDSIRVARVARSITEGIAYA